LVCEECKDRLFSRSLRPREWFNLSSLHGPFKYLIHDDFYDDDGTACQPERPVETPNLFPYPRLTEISNSLPALLNYAYSKWHLYSEVIVALGKHDKQSILNSISSAIIERQNLHVESRSYEIAACCLGTIAENWIRHQLLIYSEATYFSFYHAVSQCLPFYEGFKLTITYLEESPTKEVADRSSVLSWYRSRKVLDFIERHASSPVQESWGRLAAVSDFDWERAQQWLDSGRPLSLICLGALHSITRYDTSLLREIRPILRNAPDREELSYRIRAYERLDPVPRVERIVDSIIRKVGYLYTTESSYPEQNKKGGA